MRGLAGLAAGTLLVVAYPVLVFQAWRLKANTPRLPEADGPRSGRFDSSRPALQVLVLGESPAAGVGVKRMDQSLGPKMARALSAKTGRAVEWRVLAANGRTAAALAVHEVAELDRVPADLVVIALGVNDSLHFHSARRWINSLRILIAMVRRRCGDQVPILVTPVPRLDRFPALPGPLRHVLGLKSIALDTALARHLAGGANLARPAVTLDDNARAFFARDGFHPGPDGHERWGQRLAEAALERFPTLRAADTGSPG